MPTLSVIRAARRLRNSATALAFSMLVAYPAAAQGPDSHEAAIALARSGDYANALAALERLAAARPHDLRIGFDRIVVLGWAGNDAQALARASGLDLAGAPAYVLESIGRSARNLKRFDLAESVYRRSVSAHPERQAGRIGLALTLSDRGRHDEARRLLDEALAAVPTGADRAGLLVARANVAESAGEWPAALSRYQEALATDPQSKDAQAGLVRTAARLGAPGLAAGFAARHPGLLSAAEAAAIADDQAAIEIRWGRIQERIESGEARFAWLDRALQRSDGAAARLADARNGAAGTMPAAFDASERRLLADRIVALELRRRPEDAVALYQSLHDAGIAVPAYALASAADAMLTVRRPEEAATLYRATLQAQPDDFAASLGLFFALVESERLDEAIAHADALAARTAPLRSAHRGNADAVTARSAAVLGRVFGDRLDDAERMAYALRDAYPYNAGVREAFGSTAHARGWPRLADEEFRRALAVDPGNAGLHAERVQPLLDVYAWAEARAQLGEALDRRPDDSRVKRAQDLWTVHRMREFESSASFGRSSDATPTGTDDWRLDARVYTQPLRDRWRVFAQTSIAHADFAGDSVRWHREGLGAEYRARDLRLTAAVTDGSSGRTGLEASAARQFGDHWSVELLGSTVSANLPMQAWRAGVRANEAAATVRYAVNESRSFAAGANRLGFSDGNDRTAGWASWFERWTSTPRWRFETTAWLGASRNSLDGAPYFNPASDTTASVEAAAEWLTWRRYERSFRQRLAATVGSYSQEDFGSGAVLGLSYEHVWEFDRRLYLRYGIGRLLRPYDGERSGRSFATLSVNGRF
ncbi:MAG TPA: poly-beta-1,6 N-acetyl-D-glucosamine export porin PgaA [Burkholderiaceae bacterium]|nr:poly-beta-1,6 N-acetyl-D-glucosamine export porin PgaA [Burkholderiaceae bacterium]